MFNIRNNDGGGFIRSRLRIDHKMDKSASILFWNFWIFGFYCLENPGIVSSTPITNYYKLRTPQPTTAMMYSPNQMFQDSDTARNASVDNADVGGESQQRSEAQSWNFDPRNKDDSWNWENKIGTDDRRVDFTSSIVEVIVYIVLGLVILSFVAFLVCICCPICVFSKIRHRRRGHVYTRQTAVSTVTTGIAHPQGTQVVVIPNQRTGVPYPVQESITVIPLVPSSQQPVYQSVGRNDLRHGAYGSQPPAPPTYIEGENGMKISPIDASELPPPYPGLPTVDANSGFHQQPYNPYYGGEHTAQWQDDPDPDVVNK